jgi:UDP-N-acetylglucosamine 2-epimerase (non-hydrolysing)
MGNRPARGGKGGYGVVSIHRNENLSSRADFDLLMESVVDAAGVLPLKFVLHPATRTRIATSGWQARLEGTPRLQMMARVDYPDFVRMLVGSCLLMTDGGSNQEEAAMLGLPTLLLRRTTERGDGLDDSVELSHLDRGVISRFVQHHAGGLWDIRTLPDSSPSAMVVDEVLARRPSAGDR